MTNRENYLSIARKTGYTFMPPELQMCPSLRERFTAYAAERGLEIPEGAGNIPDLPSVSAPAETLWGYHAHKSLAEGTFISGWGVAYEPGSAAAYHMRRMHHPMETFDSVEQILAYPYPRFDPNGDGILAQAAAVKALHDAGRAAVGHMECTVWETAWYMRGMENLMCDMYAEDPMAEALLDAVTDRSVQRAISYATAGADVIFLGDDVGMQNSILMSEGLYRQWIQPRLKRVIDAARAVKPDVLIFYHSCGHVTELIPNLIEAGVDVLDPVQPECMDFRSIFHKYGDRLSFHGTLGTQSVMPFGTPEDVRKCVFENLDIAGPAGGLYVCPTHVLEPEVPVENVEAYILACRDYTERYQ
jgi:uroporphyrinogen decarboxylase